MSTKKKATILLVNFLLSVILSSITEARPNANLMNTIYTLSGIMFSIGMGIVCSFSLESIKNPLFFKEVKQEICNIRNNFLLYFSITSIIFLVYQLFPSKEFFLSIKSIKLIFSLAMFGAFITILSSAYFIVNFLAVQKLNFDIAIRKANNNE